MRYIRQTNISEIGKKGQFVFLKSKVVIIGAGALGTHFADTFVRSGIGYLKIIDMDTVNLDNIQRQTMYDETDVGQFKAKVVLEKLTKINSDVKIETVVAKCDETNIEDFVRGFDIIVDATDNFKIRFLIDKVSDQLGIPWCFTGILNSTAQTMIFNKNLSKAKFSNILGEGGIEPNNDTGILRQAVSAVVAIASLNVMKFLLGKFTDYDVIFSLDMWNFKFKKVKL